ncbi:unnamed protein product [Ectocarpus sp. CCAP 1310/34]|nr:unnamed protein product [Ectocarpus sp. CCAP 1310/34]
MSTSTRILAFLSMVVMLVPLADAFSLGSSAGWQTQAVVRPATRSTKSTTTMMMAKKNRRERRYAEAKKKKSSGSKQQPSGATSSAKWLQVLDNTSELEPGSVKVVSGKYKGEDRVFTLAAYGGTYYAVSEACGRCKFPLINGKVKLLTGGGKAEDLKPGVEQDPEAEIAIACPLCGAMFNLRTGEIAGEQPKGLAQVLVSKVVSQTPAESITTHQAQVLSTGAVVVRVD